MLTDARTDARTDDGQRTPDIEGSQKLTEHFVLRWANNFVQMSAMLRRCAVAMFDTKIGSRSRSEFKIKHCITYQVQYRSLPFKKITLFHMLHMGYSSPSVKALVYDFTPPSTKKIDSIQWHTGEDIIAFVSESTRLVSFLPEVNMMQLLCMADSQNFFVCVLREKI